MKIEAKYIAKQAQIDLIVWNTPLLDITVEEARELVRSLQSAIDSAESVWP
jgi:hypothetical protein